MLSISLYNNGLQNSPPAGFRLAIALKSIALVFIIGAVMSSSSATLFAQTSSSVTTNPKIGLVLSGGSARGFAHIGVIRALEEAGIEVHVVTGTSMGSIVGGMYAIGYTPDEMLEVAGGANWDLLFNDAPSRRNLPLARKAESDRSVLTLPIRDGRPGLPGGFIAGQRISQFLGTLTWRFHPVTNFRELPISYAAVAAEAASGKAIRLDRGYLPEAIHASMAIPSVFAPVEVDGVLLIDGGVARNLPAEDAIALGADVLICSDVSKPLVPADSLTDLLAVLDQTIGYRGWYSTLEQRALCDVLILPEINQLSSTAFDKAAEWAEYGELAAREKLAELNELGLTANQRRRWPARTAALATADPFADSVFVSRIELKGLVRATHRFTRDKLKLLVPGWVVLSDLDEGIARLYDSGRFRTVKYRLDEDRDASGGPNVDGARVLQVSVDEQSLAQLGFGYRYDSRYKASIYGYVELADPLVYGSRLNVDVRLGEQGLAIGHWLATFGRRPEFIAGAEAGYRRMPFDIYEGDLRIASPRAFVTDFSVLGGLLLGNGATVAGRVKGEYADLDEFAAAGPPFAGEDQTYYTLAGLFILDTYDRAVFPRSGAGGLVKAEWADVFSSGGSTFSHFVLDLHAAARVYEGLSLLGRVIAGSSTGTLPDNYYFFLGGTNSYFIFPDRHFPFAGLKTMQLFGQHVQALQLGMQYEFSRYLIGRLRWNGGATMAEWDLDTDLWTYGMDITVAAVTRFGHGAVSAAWDLDSGLRLVIDVGYPF